MTGKRRSHAEVVPRLRRLIPVARRCWIFSGRAMIPLEAARLGVQAEASTTRRSRRLRDASRGLSAARLVETSLTCRFRRPTYCCRADSSRRRSAGPAPRSASGTSSRCAPITRASTARALGISVGQRRLPCQECGRRFPLTGSLTLRFPLPRKKDPGQSYRIEVDRAAGTFRGLSCRTGRPQGTRR